MDFRKVTQRPWFPLYVADFWMDGFVQGLDYGEVGLYLWMLSQQWREGFLPDDPALIARRANAEQKSVEMILSEKFPVTSEGFRQNKRLAGERVKAHKVSRSRKLAAMQMHSKSKANGVQKGGIHSHSHSHSHSHKELQKQFDAFWEAYPKRAGGNPRKGALDAFVARRRDGVAADDLLAGAQRYRAWAEATGRVGTEYVKQAQFWLSPKYEGWCQDWDAPPDPGQEPSPLGIRHFDDGFPP